MRIEIQDDGTLDVYNGSHLAVSVPPASMASFLTRAEAPLQHILDIVEARPEQTRRILRLYYAGLPGEYEIE